MVLLLMCSVNNDGESTNPARVGLSTGSFPFGHTQPELLIDLFLIYLLVTIIILHNIAIHNFHGHGRSGGGRRKTSSHIRSSELH